MAERLTVVFDDDSLYRRLKVRAAESGQPLKRIVEEALLAYLGPETGAPKAFDWAAYDSWQEEVADLNAELPVPTGPPIPDLRYDRLPRQRQGLKVADERVPYDA